jgi:pimeloyl-ACP methyl ester carboxylesterase
MVRFHHDGIQFFYRDSGGDGLPFVFQHGLGGDVEQPFGLFQPPPGIRLLAFDCRAHGQTNPLGDPAKIRIAQFSADLAAFLDYLAIEQAIIGGISMGAALALRFALDYPRRVLGLVLSRPAWLDAPQPAENQAAYQLIAQLLTKYGAEEGSARFAQTEDYIRVLMGSPDAAHSLLKQFHAPLARQRAVRLEQIPAESPHPDPTAWCSIDVPTLVMANEQDPIHPFAFGQQLSRLIPDAVFRPITAKSVSRPQHEADVQRAVEQFLHKLL